MGLKSEPRQSNRAPKSLPGGKYKQEQIMKQVVETTRCTHTEAEEALIECNYDLELAVNYIIDRNGDNVWTEQKNRKAKKSETEEPTRPERAEKSDRRFNRNRTEDSDKKTFRRERNDDPEKKFVKKERTEDGEKKFVRHERTENSDRKYTNRNGNENEESSRPSGMRGGRRGGRGFYSNRERDGQGHSGENRFDKSEKKYVNHNEHNTVENREDFPAPSAVPKEIHNKAGPLSYAALVAKGNQKPPQPPIPAVAATAPATSGLPKDDSPAPEPKPIVSSSEDTQSSNNTEQKDIESATQSLTSQLKNDLGLSSHAASTATQNSPLISAASSSMKGGDKGQIAVEHAGADSVSSSGYQFGPADGQQVPQAPQQQSQLSQSIKPEEPAYVPQNNVAASDFNRTHDNGLYKPQDPIVSKPTPMVPNPQMHPMSAYGVDNSQVLMQPAMSMPRRNLGYAETNSVTIQPERPQQQQPPQQVIREAPVTTTPSYQNYNKAPVTAAASMGHPQLGVHHQQNQHQQQQMYNPMYNNFPYVNLYSPVAGRDDQTAYANPYMPYQFGMDMNSLPHVIPHLPLQHQLGHQQHHQPQGGLSHQTQSGHRNDHIQSGYSDKMQSYGQSSATSNNSVGQNGQRENSNVPPPPGFSGPPGNMGNHNFTWRRFL